MVQPWMRWCRLCAREDQDVYNNCHINVSLKDEEGIPLFDTIYKCFSIDIKSCDNFPNMKICIECYNHIRTTINLNQRIPKVTAMLTELLVKNEDKEFDLNQIKIRHDLDSDFKIFTMSPEKEDHGIKFEDNDSVAEKEEMYYQSTELDPSDMKIEQDDESEYNYDSDDESSNECNAFEEKAKRELVNRPKKYKPRKERLAEDKLKPHFCSDCQKGFTKFFSYRRHMRIKHKVILEKQKSRFICTMCGQDCRSPSALAEHELTHSDQRAFKCRTCEKSFKTGLSLRQHEDTHRGVRFVCVECGAQFNTQQKLKRHMVRHSDERKYKCDFCPNEYKRSNALKTHLLIHTGLRPYACNFCDKTYNSLPNFSTHKKKKHAAEMAALEAAGKKDILKTVVPNLNELKAITAKKVEMIKNEEGKKDDVDICQ